MHDLEQRTDGTFSYVGAREPAWHKLGKTYEGVDGLTVAQVLDDLDVGEIVKLPLTATHFDLNGVTTLTAPKHMITARVRKDSVVPLGVVGLDYKVFGEAESFQFLDNLIDGGEALVSAAGLLDDGRKAFCCMRLPQGVNIGGVDPVDLYMLVATSHDGSLRLTAAATPIRVVCQNTLTVGLKQAKRVWRVKHTVKAELRVEEARRALDLTYAYSAEWAALAERLVDRKVTDRRFDSIITGLYGPKEGQKLTKQAAAAWDKKRTALIGLWGADTQANIKNTAWGAYNTIIEYIDWGRQVRGADDPDTRRFATAVEQALYDLPTSNPKNRALTAVITGSR